MCMLRDIPELREVLRERIMERQVSERYVSTIPGPRGRNLIHTGVHGEPAVVTSSTCVQVYEVLILILMYLCPHP